MESIILVYGDNKKVNKNYIPRSLAGFDLSSESPFWLDVLSPSEHLLHRISIQLGFHPRTIRACLSTRQSPSCEDFDDYLFVQAFLLEPSRRNLFIKRDMNIFLCSDYLITIHKDRILLHHSLPGLHGAGFYRSSTLLLTFFDWSIDTLLKGFSRDNNFLISKDGKPNKKPFPRQLKNLKDALMCQEELLHEFAHVGARYFDAEGKSIFESIVEKMFHLSTQVNGSLIGA